MTWYFVRIRVLGIVCALSTAIAAIGTGFGGATAGAATDQGINGDEQT